MNVLFKKYYVSNNSKNNRIFPDEITYDKKDREDLKKIFENINHYFKGKSIRAVGTLVNENIIDNSDKEIFFRLDVMSLKNNILNHMIQAYFDIPFDMTNQNVEEIAYFIKNKLNVMRTNVLIPSKKAGNRIDYVKIKKNCLMLLLSIYLRKLPTEVQKKIRFNIGYKLNYNGNNVNYYNSTTSLNNVDVYSNNIVLLEQENQNNNNMNKRGITFANNNSQIINYTESDRITIYYSEIAKGRLKKTKQNSAKKRMTENGGLDIYNEKKIRSDKFINALIFDFLKTADKEPPEMYKQNLPEIIKYIEKRVKDNFNEQRKIGETKNLNWLLKTYNYEYGTNYNNTFDKTTLMENIKYDELVYLQKEALKLLILKTMFYCKLK